MITGAMKTTSTEALDALANLLPFHLLADKIRHQAALRMATIAETHPLRKMVMKATARGYVKSHPSPMHELMFTYNLNPRQLEVISSVRDANRYCRQANVLIASTKEEAMQTEDLDTADVKIFTDGSAIHGKVGAAAVIYREGNRTNTIWKHLGSDEEHTVHEAECVAILMGLHTIKRWKYKRVTIYADNQAALQGLTASAPGPGKYILDAIHKEISKAAETNGGDRIRLRWIPGHQGVKGNEAADVEAKRAAEGETSPGKDLPKILKKELPTNKAAAKQRFSKEVKEVRAERWKQHTEGRFIAKTAPELPSKKHCAKLGELTRKGASIWTQLKTGHVGLNKHLHRIKVVESPKCARCKIYNESVEHYLLHCKAYKRERITMKRSTKGGTKDIGRLLGNQRNAKAVVDYVIETGRLKWVKKDDKEEAAGQKAKRKGQQGERGREGERRGRREEGAGREEAR
jgi:ribonuclease HI